MQELIIGEESMLKRKKLFILFILLFLGFGNNALAETRTITYDGIDSGGNAYITKLEIFGPTEIYVGTPISLTVTILGIWNDWEGRVYFGDGGVTDELSCSGGGWNSCKMSDSYKYLESGIFTISGSASQLLPTGGIRTVIFPSYTINVLSKGCIPNGCGGGCPSECTVDEDPDCACVSDNGCCPDDCTYITDADCDPNDNKYRYKNPLIFTNIVQFIWHSLTFIFTLLISLSILFILIGAYVLVTSGGNQIKVNKGKKIIIFTLIGFAIALISRGIIALLLTMMGE